jgi:hypothetical protein
MAKSQRMEKIQMITLLPSQFHAGVRVVTLSIATTNLVAKALSACPLIGLWSRWLAGF